MISRQQGKARQSKDAGHIRQSCGCRPQDYRFADRMRSPGCGHAPMDFAAGPWLCAAMRYRIDMPQSRNGYARLSFPGRVLALEANRHVGPVWLVRISDLASAAPVAARGSVTVRAGSAGEAVWRVARAAVRAVAEITRSPPRKTAAGEIIGSAIESGS